MNKFDIKGYKFSYPVGTDSEEGMDEYVKTISGEMKNQNLRGENRKAIQELLEGEILKKKNEWFERQMREEMYKKQMKEHGKVPVDVIAMLSGKYNEKA